MIIRKRTAKCNNPKCGHEFSTGKAEKDLQCGKCGSKDVSVILSPEQASGEEEAPLEAPKPPISLEIGKSKLTREIKLPKIIDLSPKTLSMVDRLVNEKGMFPDMKECVNRAIEMMVTQIENPRYMDYIFKGGTKMPEEEPNPEKELKKIQVNDILEAQIEKKKAEAQAIREKFQRGEASKSDLLNVMKEQFEIKQMQTMMDKLEGGESGGGGLKDIKEMLSMKWMMDMIAGSNHPSGKGNGESLELQRKIDDLQKEIRDQKILNEVKTIMAVNSKGMNPDDYLKIFADKFEAIEKQKIETEKAKQDAVKEREERFELQRQHQFERVHGNIKELEDKFEKAKEKGSSLGKISELKESIQAAKEFAKEFGEQPKEKSTGEIASELVFGIADKLKDPITMAVKGFADKHAAEKLRAEQFVNQPYPNPENLGSPQSTYPPVYSPTYPESSLVTEVGPTEPPPLNISSSPEDQIVNTFAGQNTAKK